MLNENNNSKCRGGGKYQYKKYYLHSRIKRFTRVNARAKTVFVTNELFSILQPTNMKVLIMCEESQAICKEFRSCGHEAYSNDLQKCSGGRPEWHLQMDCFEAAEQIKPDLAIGHPVCKYLSNAGIGYFDFMKYDNAFDRWRKRIDASEFFMKMWNLPIKRICLENPIGWINGYFPATQVINPSFFGEPQNKRTGLWLKNLPLLVWHKENDLFATKTLVDVEPVYIDKSGKPRYFTDSISGGNKNAEMMRSKTFISIAKAMAKQWGGAGN